MLKLRERRAARDAARLAWISAEGSVDNARLEFSQDERIAKLSPATILALMQLALQLWMWWQEHKVSEPSVVASSEEPGGLTTEDDDDA